jgi:hypothetical protein
VHALPGLCALNIFEYDISLSCGKFINHHREPLSDMATLSIGANLWWGGGGGGGGVDYSE